MTDLDKFTIVIYHPPYITEVITLFLPNNSASASGAIDDLC